MHAIGIGIGKNIYVYITGTNMGCSGIGDILSHSSSLPVGSSNSSSYSSVYLRGNEYASYKHPPVHCQATWNGDLYTFARRECYRSLGTMRSRCCQWHRWDWICIDPSLYQCAGCRKAHYRQIIGIDQPLRHHNTASHLVPRQHRRTGFSNQSVCLGRKFRHIGYCTRYPFSKHVCCHADWFSGHSLECILGRKTRRFQIRGFHIMHHAGKWHVNL